MIKRGICLSILFLIGLFGFMPLISATLVNRGPYWNKFDNNDGTFTLEITELINYYNGTDYEPINTTLTTINCEDYDYCVEKGAYQAYFKTSSASTEIIKYTLNNKSISYTPFKLQYTGNNKQDLIANSGNVNGFPTKNKFTYPEIYGSGFNLSFTYQTTRLKEELTIGNRSDLPEPQPKVGSNPYLSLEFKIRIDNINAANHKTKVVWNKVDDFVVDGRVDFRDSNNNTLFFLPKAYAYDSNNSRINLTYEFKKSGINLFVNLKTPYSWLNATERIYPIMIDPTTELSSEASSAASKNSNADTNFGSDNFIAVGKSPSDLGEIRSFLLFNISAIPNNTKIESALMHLWLYEDNTESSARVINAHRVTEEWLEDEVTWNDRKTGVSWNNPGGDFDSTITNSTTIPATPSDNWYTWDLTNLTKEWYNNTYNNYGIVLKKQDTDVWEHKFYSDDYVNTSLKPKLVVNYTLLNQPPIVSSLSLTPSQPKTTNDLTCSFVITDQDAGDSLTANITWYKNNVVYSSTTQSVTNGTQTSSILDSTNTAKNEEWNCTVIPYDETDYGTQDSKKVTIQNSQPTAPNISITPSSPNTNNDLNVVFNAVSQDNDSDSITYSYAWYKDDVLQPGITGSTVSNGVTSKNQVWKVIVTPNDGEEDGTAAQTNVTIQNSLPSITSASITPETAYKTTTLTASTEGWSDLDNEPENYIYQWFNQNGAITGATSPTLTGTFFNKSDQIYCNVTPYDSDDYGTSKLTNTVIIQNSLPTLTISLVTELGFNGTDEDLIASFTYSDADSDTITNNQTKWFKDNIEQTNLVDLTIISYTNTSADDVWVFSARLYDGESWSNWYNASITILDISQTYPTLVSPSNGTYFNVSSVVLTYTAPNYANMNCTIFADTSSNPTTPIKNNTNLQGKTTIIYNWKNLADNIYYWKAGCTNNSILYNSTIKSFTIDTTYPTTAPILTQDGVTDSDNDGNIELSWTADPDAATYNIYRSSTQITDATNLTKIDSTSLTSWEDNTTLHNNTYWYAITTVDRAGNENKSIVSDSFNATSNDTIKPKLPTNVNASSLNGVTTLYWTKATKDINGNSDQLNLQYKIWYAKNSTINLSKTLVNETADYIKTVGQDSCSENSCLTTHSLSGSTVYYYFITTIDDANNENLTLNNNFANVTVTITPPGGAPGGGGGGGGGGTSISIPKAECKEHWSCSEWYSCIKGVQARTCIDINNCGTEKNKPKEIRPCAPCKENWQCGDWTPCVNNRQTRVCIDKNDCGTEKNKPAQERDCAIDTCSDRIKNYGEVGIDCGGPCRPCKASDFITGSAIALKATKGPNPFLLIPTIFLLISFIIIRTIRKSDVINKIVSALHIPMIILIVVLFIFSFFGPQITGLFIASNETIKEEPLDYETDKTKEIAKIQDLSFFEKFNETKLKISSTIFLIIISLVLIGFIVKKRFPTKFRLKKGIKESKKPLEKADLKHVSEEKPIIEQIKDMEIEITTSKSQEQRIREEPFDKEEIAKEPDKQEILNQIKEAYKLNQIK